MKLVNDLVNIDFAIPDRIQKILNIIDITNTTSDEYYENIVFAEAYNILVPATGEEPKVEIGNFIMPLLICEGLIFVVFAAIIIFSSISIDSNKRKDKVNTAEKPEVTDVKQK